MYHSARLLWKEGSKVSKFNPAIVKIEITHHALPGGKSVIEYRYKTGKGWVYTLGWNNPLHYYKYEQQLVNKLWRNSGAICEF